MSPAGLSGLLIRDCYPSPNLDKKLKVTFALTLESTALQSMICDLNGLIQKAA